MDTISGKVKWIDILKPTEKDIAWLKKKYHLHPLILDELKGPSARYRIEEHPQYLYLIYYFPIYDPIERVSRRSEIDFVITKKAVITVHYEKVETMEQLKKTLRARSHVFNDTVQLTHKILESLLTFQQRQLNHIREKVEIISVELFKERERQRERQLLEQISYVKRDLSQYRIIVRPQKHILESFLHVGCSFLGGTCDVFVNDLLGEHLKILDQLEDYRQGVEDFESTNNQLIGIKNSQVVKTFTILAFLTFPMMLFAALFSMNTVDTPFVGQPGDFYFIFSVMAIAMLCMYLYFRRRDWL